MAISDDNGQSWHASEPLCGFGNIQPAVLRRNDGSLVAYMRENGILDKIRTSESRDDGETWGPVGVADLPNPGAGIDGLRLANGHWLLIYNDTTKGRNSLAVSISEDEGKSWTIMRHLEKHEDGSYHYPAVIQGSDGTLHFIYSYFVKGGKSMKHVAANEAWVRQGDAGTAAPGHVELPTCARCWHRCRWASTFFLFARRANGRLCFLGPQSFATANCTARRKP